MSITIHSSDEIYNHAPTYKRLKFLTNGGWGRHERGSGMLDKLEVQYKGTIFLYKIDERVVGWSMLVSQRQNARIGQVDVYVSCHHRRKGIASKLLAEVKRYCERRGMQPVCSAWDRKGSKLYEKMNIKKAVYWEYPDWPFAL